MFEPRGSGSGSFFMPEGPKWPNQYVREDLLIHTCKFNNYAYQITSRLVYSIVVRGGKLINEKVGIDLKNLTELQKVIEEIEQARMQLNKMVSKEKDGLIDPNIIKLSELLDQLLVKYYHLK